MIFNAQKVSPVNRDTPNIVWIADIITKVGVLYVDHTKDDMLKKSIAFLGASLSEPHTSVTALRTCVCMFVCLLACLDQPLTVNFKRAHANIS